MCAILKIFYKFFLNILCFHYASNKINVFNLVEDSSLQSIIMLKLCESLPDSAMHSCHLLLRNPNLSRIHLTYEIYFTWSWWEFSCDASIFRVSLFYCKILGYYPSKKYYQCIRLQPRSYPVRVWSVSISHVC